MIDKIKAQAMHYWTDHKEVSIVVLHYWLLALSYNNF